jgi:hypothetical protein
MKIIISLLVIVVLAGIEVRATDPSSTKPWPPPSQPTLNNDLHDPPVYTSPTNDVPPASHFTNVITAPVITNWPATNFPATNHLPVLPNPPASPPSDGQQARCGKFFIAS